jgi:hypothetical protein
VGSSGKEKRTWKEKIFHELAEYWLNVVYPSLVLAAFTQ